MRAEQAEPVGGRGQRGVVQEWVDQQRAAAWEARAISAEAANRDLEARLSKANEDRRDSESRLADVTKERDRLATNLKTLERDVATLRKAKPAAQPAEAVERAEGAEAPPGDKGGPVPPVSSTSWPVHRRGMASHVKFVRNSYEIRTKFVRISCESRANFTFSEYSHNSIHVKFARNSHKFRTNFVQISHEFM